MTQNNRIKPTPNQKTLLLAEVNCCCPICQKPLIEKRKDRQLNRYEIAHIYPFSPTKAEEELLEGEERLSDDVNALDNLIALCNNCHEDIDNPRTVDGYRKLVTIKKRLLDRTRSKGIYNNPLFEEDIVFVINALAECSSDELTNLNYDVLSIDSKLQECKDSIRSSTCTASPSACGGSPFRLRCLALSYSIDRYFWCMPAPVWMKWEKYRG